MRDLGLVFAAGGNRSFYQLGLMRGWRDLLLPRTRVVAACSAGACMAVVSLTGREAEAEEFWKRRREGLDKNFDWRRLLSGRRPTPHEEIYRETLLCALAGSGFERVRSQPFPVYVLTTGYPKVLPPMLAALLGLCAYKLDGRHPRGARPEGAYARRAGFTPVAYDVRSCDAPETLADLIIASSSTPPFTAVGKVSGRRLLDGGIIDTAPVFLTDTVPGVRRKVVFLTNPRPADAPDAGPDFFYAAPETALNVDTWDVTRPERIEETILRGERDAGRLGPGLEEFLRGA